MECSNAFILHKIILSHGKAFQALTYDSFCEKLYYIEAKVKQASQEQKIFAV